MDETNSTTSSPTKTPPKVDGGDFLTHLRAAGEFGQGQASTNINDKLEETNEVNPRQDFNNVAAAAFSNHPRTSSMGSTNGPAFSILKQPLPSPLAKPNVIQQHARGVSWGKSVEYNADDDVSSIGVAPGAAGGRRLGSITMDGWNQAGQFADEAESNILRSIEQQSSQSDLRYTTENLLSGVPEDAAHDFSQEPVSEQRTTSVAEEEAAEEETTERSERRPLMKPIPHRRTQSVEATLAGLTDMMSAIHEDNSKNRRKSLAALGKSFKRSKRHLDLGGDERSRSFDSDVAPEPVSTGEHFADNAARLADSDPKSNGLWGTLFENLPTLKEETRVEGTATEQPESSSGSDDLEAGRGDNSGNHKSRRSSRKAMVNEKFKHDVEIWTNFFRPRRETIWIYMKVVLFYIIAPLLTVAACLFYIPEGGNPIAGISVDGNRGEKPSISWCFTFIVRLVVTFSLALGIQGFIIDFLALGTKIMIHTVGPVITLLVVQAKGWPFILFWFGILNLALNCGNSDFAHHWLFWQDTIGLFNNQNPSGHVVDNPWNRRVIVVAISVSAVVAVKRFIVGLAFGRQTFHNFGADLAKVMNKMVLVSEVAALARSFEKVNGANATKSINSETGAQLQGITTVVSEDDDDNQTSATEEKSERVFQMDNRDPITGSLRESERTKLMQILGRWEDPESGYNKNREIATISAVLKFRKALTLIQRNYPFSYSFGLADTRENCVNSAQKVFDRLMLKTPGKSALPFETIALVALTDDGKTIDQNKAKDLVKLFRPDRDGNLSMLDFIKSVDNVYKTYRLLIASIDNSGQIDRAFENIINAAFYFLVIVVTFSQLGVNLLPYFLSVSSFLLAFVFMIGSASSKYFEGVLFILCRRPYNIGDRIHVSGIETDTSFDGAPGWTVEHVTLFETVVRWVPTQELASLSNGSLANSRIINWTKSTQAQFHIWLKIPIGSPFEKIVVLKAAIEEYLKARPREWLSFNGFRANKIDAERAYVEYMVVVQHRDSWHNIGQILDSKANLACYIQEVCAQLGMVYRPPALPVDMRYNAVAPMEFTAAEEASFDADAKLQDFKGMTHKHNLRT